MCADLIQIMNDLHNEGGGGGSNFFISLRSLQQTDLEQGEEEEYSSSCSTRCPSSICSGEMPIIMGNLFETQMEMCFLALTNVY